MTDTYQSYEDPDVTQDSNLQSISMTSDYESASNLFDTPSHTVTGGVKTATATPDDGLVTYEGIQLDRETAIKLGLIAPTAEAPIAYAVDGVEDTETSEASDDVLGDIPTLTEEQFTFIDSVISKDGGAMTAAISDILSAGDLSEDTFNRIALASGADEAAINSTIADVSTNIDASVEALSGIVDASELLRLASESSPQMVKTAVMSAALGDVANAVDIAKETYRSLDQTTYGNSLVETLQAAGYKTSFPHGRLVIQGELCPQPTAWSTACSLFSLTFTD